MKTYSFWETRSPEHTFSEVLDPTSMSVPDMSLSVKDILQRYRRGTIDLQSLLRSGGDLDRDLDDDSFDGIDDIVDLHLHSRSNYDKVDSILRDVSSPPASDSHEIQGSETNAVEEK